MKRVALLFLDLFLIACATLLALLLRDNFVFSESHLQAIMPYLVVTPVSGGSGTRLASAPAKAQ